MYRKLKVEETYMQCKPEGLRFRTTADIEPVTGTIG